MKILTDLLISQTREAHDWVNKLICDIPADIWFITPDILETNFAWQIGHLTLSQYYYTVVLITGPQKDFAEKINVKKYSPLFANGLKRKELFPEVTAIELVDIWGVMCDKTIQMLHTIQDEGLAEQIYKMPKLHPFVKTRQDSISWNIKHTMWHCGQMGIVKRVIDKPFDFGM